MTACLEAELTAGSLDTLRILFVDRYKSALTGKITETPINLTVMSGIKAWIIFVPETGVEYEGSLDFTMDPDQANNTGYAYHDLTALEWTTIATANLIAGSLSARGQFTDQSGRPRIQPESIVWEVAAHP